MPPGRPLHRPAVGPIRQDLQCDTDRYLGYLASLSASRILPDDHREQALAEAGRLLDAHGGGIDVLQVTDVFLARTL
ncbi:hypothetical protein ABZ454_23620 [Streptomyces sp. NPDC005803]|uniref:hypothetical protein n=1 Tax=Streptomyces sp. NPDC005803 TaxID=3154297 RepID=UPI003406CE5F